jgi:hypothetical protein
LFDRHIGADLLRASFKGAPLGIDPAREDFALKRLAGDLEESGATVTRAAGGLILADGRVITLSHPFLDREPCSKRARELADGKSMTPVDLLLVLRALPIASNVALAVMDSEATAALQPSADGIPELKPEQAIEGNVKPPANAPRFAVAGAEEDDFLFRINANTMSGKKGDGAGAPVPKGTLCLFRPFSGEASKVDAYLIRRTDGRAFGATGSAWTVGLLQQVNNDGMRVRYRAAAQYMECASELVLPGSAVEPIAVFVKAVN